MRILVVEDETAIQSVLKELLVDAGYEVSVASDDAEAIEVFQREPFDLVLLDIMLPRLDGYSVCGAIRAKASTPIIMLTALDEEAAQVKAFELKVDDYITKPFSIKLVLLQVRAVLRRAACASADSVLRHGEIRLDPKAMEVCVHGRKVALMRIEYELLRLFMAHPRQAFTRESLLIQFGDTTTWETRMSSIFIS